MVADNKHVKVFSMKLPCTQFAVLRNFVLNSKSCGYVILCTVHNSVMVVVKTKSQMCYSYKKLIHV